MAANKKGRLKTGFQTTFFKVLILDSTYGYETIEVVFNFSELSLSDDLPAFILCAAANRRLLF